jgi:hypothetical protein
MNEYLRVARLGSLGRVVVIVLATAGCAGTPPPKPIRYADFGSVHVKAEDLRLPFVVEFQAGEQLPVNFEFSSEEFELSPAHPSMTLVAKQHCFVRFSAEGVRASLDPRNFDQTPKAPGSFRFGLKVTSSEPTKLDVAITTPRR